MIYPEWGPWGTPQSAGWGGQSAAQPLLSCCCPAGVNARCPRIPRGCDRRASVGPLQLWTIDSRLCRHHPPTVPTPLPHRSNGATLKGLFSAWMNERRNHDMNDCVVLFSEKEEPDTNNVFSYQSISIPFSLSFSMHAQIRPKSTNRAYMWLKKRGTYVKKTTKYKYGKWLRKN